MTKMKKTIAAGLVAITLAGGAIASAAPASAQQGFSRGYGYGYGYRHRAYRPHYGGGGAVAAGLIGGLALGALAARPAYGYAPVGYYGGYAPVGYYGGYAPVGYGYGGECFVERRRSIDPWGRMVVRKIRTCY
jgi:hypothetical protein